MVAETAPSPAPAAPNDAAEPRRAALFAANAQTDRALATVFVGFPVAALSADPKRAAAYDVLAAILARGAGGILPARLRGVPGREALSVEADYFTQSAGAMFVVQATSAKKSIGRIEDAVIETLSDLAQKLADGDATTFADEIADAQAAALAEVRYARETVDGEARYEAFLDTVNAPEGYAETYAERVRAVTAADILRVLEREVTARKRVVSVVGLAPLGGAVVTSDAQMEATP